jgi:Tol biopolymer transport system component
MKRLVSACVAALALFGCASAVGAAREVRHDSSAARPIANGKLAYATRGGALNTSRLYAVDQDGAGGRILARCSRSASRDCRIGGYAWSPGGKRIAFLRGVRGGNLSLFVVKADGTRERRVAGCGKPKWPSCSIRTFEGRLSWSPDGSRLVVTRDGSLFILNVDRGGVRRVLSCGRAASCIDPSWAPRGGRIVFARSGSIYSVRTDGSDLTRLTNLAGYATDPVWSPDGSRIAFRSGVGEGERVYSMSEDGSELTLLSSGPSGSGPSAPLWSPEGTQLVFLSTPGSPGAYIAEVWVIKADGSEPRRLHQSRCCVGGWAAPIWSPDGRYIAFGFAPLIADPERTGIFIIRAEGTQLRKLTTDVAEVAWQRKP